LTITVGPENGSGEVHVTTSDGCPWDAAITSGGIVESLEPTEETGSATITYSIANNTGSEPRYGTLRVAGKDVGLTQAGRFSDPVCNYSLSSSLDTVPLEGGSRFVDVITTPGCSWSALSSASWVQLVGSASGVGPGRLTYSVDANTGGGRSTSLLVASRGLDLLQVGRDPVTETPILTWDEVPVSVDQDSILYRPFQAYIWESYPNRHAPELGECFGNCGAGCSSRFNPCGGRTQWWELKILTEPEHIEGSRWQDIRCYDDFFYLYDFERYRAMGRWIYHGHSAAGCLIHDSACPEATWLGCLAFGGCGTEWDKDWSYDDLVIASKVAEIQELGPGVCP
jgi:hypothetical protein